MKEDKNKPVRKPASNPTSKAEEIVKLAGSLWNSNEAMDRMKAEADDVYMMADLVFRLEAQMIADKNDTETGLAWLARELRSKAHDLKIEIQKYEEGTNTYGVR